jgi:serine/threonine protein kinase
MSGGSLKATVLRQMANYNEEVYSLNDALRWSLQIAQALSYLHSAQPMVSGRTDEQTD